MLTIKQIEINTATVNETGMSFENNVIYVAEDNFVEDYEAVYTKTKLGKKAIIVSHAVLKSIKEKALNASDVVQLAIFTAWRGYKAVLKTA